MSEAILFKERYGPWALIVGGSENQDEALRRMSQMPRGEAVASIVLPPRK